MEKDIKRQTIDPDMLLPIDRELHGPAPKEEFIIRVEIPTLIRWFKQLFKKENT